MNRAAESVSNVSQKRHCRIRIVLIFRVFPVALLPLIPWWRCTLRIHLATVQAMY
jgi:hypothetical protein